jgi:hypothetical protein
MQVLLASDRENDEQFRHHVRHRKAAVLALPLSGVPATSYPYSGRLLPAGYVPAGLNGADPMLPV